jgi:hypothetical protein
MQVALITIVCCSHALSKIVLKCVSAAIKATIKAFFWWRFSLMPLINSDGIQIGAIERGIMALIAVEKQDSEKSAQRLFERI